MCERSGKWQFDCLHDSSTNQCLYVCFVCSVFVINVWEMTLAMYESESTNSTYVRLRRMLQNDMPYKYVHKKKVKNGDEEWQQRMCECTVSDNVRVWESVVWETTTMETIGGQCRWCQRKKWMEPAIIAKKNGRGRNYGEMNNYHDRTTDGQWPRTAGNSEPMGRRTDNNKKNITVQWLGWPSAGWQKDKKRRQSRSERTETDKRGECTKAVGGSRSEMTTRNKDGRGQTMGGWRQNRARRNKGPWTSDEPTRADWKDMAELDRRNDMAGRAEQ